ncbi:outer membrane protein assembly factor BamB family protein [Allosalinactinospora lopnorensis]|uniref:outer membrane protein assembly factor BamB family protein n=1 Tax=Allosalinactinospora lopnorensis TaxID=1352348 RepID=UPI000623BAB1|nr:PQQ-binding-like beta-propeller repeat protein [Allosalinactinospora lopnorensis]
MFRYVRHAATAALVLGSAAVLAALVMWEEDRDGAFPFLLGLALLGAAATLVPALVRGIRTLVASTRGRKPAPPEQHRWGFPLVITFVVAGYCGWLSWEVFGTGLLGEALPLLAAGVLVVLLALGAHACAARRPAATENDPRPVPASPVRVGAATASGAAVATLLLPAYFAVPVLAVDTSTAEPPQSEPADVPDTVSEEGWRWQAPDGTRVRDAVRTGPGMVVLLDDSVVALDGQTGKQRWHHRRFGTQTQDLITDAGGTAVAVTFLAGADTADGEIKRTVAVFDAATGEPGYSETDRVSRPGTRVGESLGLTRNGIVLRGEDGVIVLDREDGRERWRWTAPDGCSLALSPASIVFGDFALLPEAAALAMYCGAPEEFDDAQAAGKGGRQTFTLLALDDRDGDELWRFEDERVVGSVGTDLSVSADGAALAVERSMDDSDDRSTQFFDTGSGEPVSEEPSEFSVANAWTTHGGPSKDRASWTRFDSGHHFTETGVGRAPEGGPLEYAWHPNDGGDPRTAVLHDYCTNDRDDESEYSPVPYGRALDDAVLSVCVTGANDPETLDSVEVSVAAAPWGSAGKPDPLTLDLDVENGNAGVYDWPTESPPLFLAPGAAVVTLPSATEVVGLQ